MRIFTIVTGHIAFFIYALVFFLTLFVYLFALFVVCLVSLSLYCCLLSLSLFFARLLCVYPLLEARPSYFAYLRP